MKNILKKIACFSLAICLCLGALVSLTGCFGKDDEDARLMNVDVNPKLEFVLDEDNKVVSVTALNDDGLCILQGDVSFDGKTAEEAVKLFLEKAKEYGFVVEADTNALTVSISGENADKLLNKVKASAEAKVAELGLHISVAKEKLNKEALEQIVAKCYGELTQEEIDEMDSEELAELIEESREETKDLLTEDLRNLYYTERAQAVMEARINEIKTQVNAGSDLAKKMLITALESAYEALQTAYNQMQAFYTDAINNLSTQAESYVELKKQYIAERKAGDTAGAQAIHENLNRAKETIDQARGSIETNLEGVKTSLESAKNLVVSKINELLEGLNDDAIESKINTAKTNVLTTLKSTYENVNKNHWEENE